MLAAMSAWFGRYVLVRSNLTRNTGSIGNQVKTEGERLARHCGDDKGSLASAVVDHATRLVFDGSKVVFGMDSFRLDTFCP